jgi:hypothetical protein
MVERFRARYARGAPFREDRLLAKELGWEARPVLEALRAALRDVDPTSIAHHEGLALLTLLGRRAGRLGATPTAALGIVPALFTALGRQPTERELTALQALSLEGYVAGREERLVEEAARAAMEATPIVEVAPRCIAAFFAGLHEPEALGEIVERLGSLALRTDAAAVVVDVSRLLDPTPERAAEVLGADAAARMLGATCVFAGIGPWLEAARRTGVDERLIVSEPDFPSALKRALAAAGLAIRPTSRWRKLLGNDE